MRELIIKLIMMTSSNGDVFRIIGHFEGNPPVTGGFPPQTPVAQSFDVFFDARPNKRLSKQSTGWWFDTPWRSSWRHCNVVPRVEYLRVFKGNTLHDRWCSGSLRRHVISSHGVGNIVKTDIFLTDGWGLHQPVVRPTHERNFSGIRNWIKFRNALDQNTFGRSQQNFAYVTTVTLSWRVQNFVGIGWAYLKPESSKFFLCIHKTFQHILVIPSFNIPTNEMTNKCTTVSCINPNEFDVTFEITVKKHAIGPWIGLLWSLQYIFTSRYIYIYMYIYI